MFRRRHISIGSAVWLIVGVIVASSHHFFANLASLSRVLSAVLAVIVWPLVLLHIHIAI
jgi:hypothetical protein